jgi:hypothetical protein
MLALMVIAGSAASLSAPALAAGTGDERVVEIPTLHRLRADTSGRVYETPIDGVLLPGGPGTTGPYTQRDGCPQVSSHTTTSFEGGTYAVQAGFAENEAAVVSYTLSRGNFPARLALMEFILAQQNATVTTTTQYLIQVWNGNPNTGQLIGEFESDPSGFPLPQLVMAPGTRGTNVQVSVDPSDPEQIILTGDDPITPNTFSIGIRILQHNDQTGDGCSVAPPANRNAFPVTDNTSAACGIGYAQLQQPNRNWLNAINCGPLGCPPGGGWARFTDLAPDSNILGICLPGCRPRGDWVIRATWDPVNCPGVPGACCFGTTGCVAVLDAAACADAGGTFLGAGLTCEDANGNGRADVCEAPPPNQLPVAEAGDNSTFTDDDNDGFALVVLNGSASSDPDGTITSYAWSLGGVPIAQSTQAITTATLGIGTNIVRLDVTDDRNGTDEDFVVVTVLPGSTCPVCAADFDQDGGVTGADIEAFFIAFETGDPCGDTDQDGGITGADIEAFFTAFEAGGC